MPKSQKWLIVWSVFVVTVAVVLKLTPLGESAAIIAGTFELLLALVTGVAFGLVVARTSD